MLGDPLFFKEASGPYSSLMTPHWPLIMLNRAWFECCHLVRIGVGGAANVPGWLPLPLQLVAPLSRGEPTQPNLAVVKTFRLAMTPDLSIKQACVSGSSYVCAERSERKTYLKVSVLGSQYFCSFWLKLLGLKFSFSSCLPVFTLRYLLSYSVIMFSTQPQEFRWSWHWWKKTRFPDFAAS